MSDLRKACVVGWPARHSRSPLIHRYWLRLYGIEADYVIEETKPEEFAGFIASLAGRGYAGCNVTIPFKEEAARLVDRLESTASALGAANTLWFEDGILHGANTDVFGFLANLDAGAPGWDADLDRAVVLGAGGAARGIVFGLISRGVRRVDIVNRTAERATALQSLFDRNVVAHPWEGLPAVLAGARLLVNTTSLGMEGKPPLEIGLAGLDADAVVNDIVYVPLETDLLEQARALGRKGVDGLGMLLHQAVHGFEKWFGVRPEVTDDLRAVLVADIEDGRGG